MTDNFNELLFENDARQKLLVGATKLTKAVKSTLGPKGRNVIIQRSNHEQLVTKDGVTVAESITLKDKFENLGAQLVREVATRTSETAGDGTTTATVLAHTLLTNGNALINEGHDPVMLKRGMEIALSDITQVLQQHSTEISSFIEVEHIGTISANNDKIIGSIIANAMREVGKEGVITIEESNNFETRLEIVQGIRFDRGYASHFFITNLEREEVVFSEPLILITNKKFTKMAELVPILEGIARLDRELLIVAGDIEGEALNALVINKVRGAIKVCAVRAPSFGEQREKLLKDLATVTGAKYFDVNTDKDFTAQFDVDALGSARRIIVSKSTTTIVDGACTQENLNNRINLLKEQLSQENLVEREIESLKYRIAALSGGIAIIKVGAFTELELKEKVARIEDALNATQAAVDEGIVKGGGLALLTISNELQMRDYDANDDPSLTEGRKLVIQSCRAPFEQINKNAGFDPLVIQEKLNKENFDGFNTLTGEYVNMYDAGIIDPTKVERCALENAVSVTSLLLTTDTLITTEKCLISTQI
ncbi:chaperonin GroEL [Candidatus Pacearchaeota archaeon]|nr:chaperonin GroEL [Candidatus Pacearchaeota archaeon]|tara:strand:+ start:60924 stop:62540 length:1617 start_codon:yes stop_codon:yes gene_type:complete